MQTELKNYKLFYKSTFGNIYTTVNPIDNKYISEKSYYLVLNDFTVVGYSLISNFSFSGDKVTLFKHLDNTQNTAQFRPISSGCGGDYYSSIITDSSLLDKKNLIGNSDDGFQVFQITSADSPLVQFLYKQYKVGRDYPSAPPIISLDQFAQAPNHIIYQETNGDWVILTNPEYSVQAECGKPVIYLYPEKDTQVSVKVGANITKSEPTYPRNGWTVLAHPNGQLDYQNSVYPNLFWEGTGLGIYANHAGEGFVVPQSKLISTINSHLKLQGLNTQESKDFMEFWTDKLPQTPYVRLTWLDTTDMNVLAPLSVSPRPKSVIRIFLEFEGLEKNIYLKPQKLTTINRDGFTLVEWGGLLR